MTLAVVVTVVAAGVLTVRVDNADIETSEVEITVPDSEERRVPRVEVDPQSRPQTFVTDGVPDHLAPFPAYLAPGPAAADAAEPARITPLDPTPPASPAPGSSSGGGTTTTTRPSGRSVAVASAGSGSPSATPAPPPPTTTAPPPPPPTSPPPPPGGYVTPGGAGAGATSTTLNVDTISLNTPGQVFENTTVNGCLTVDADNVTIRNVKINCDTTYPIKDNGSNGTRVERVTIDCLNTTQKGIYFLHASNFRVNSVHITRCDDQFFIDGGLGYSTITNSVFHNQAPASEAHTDGMQIGTFETTTGTLVVDGNWWEYNRSGCCDNGVLFLSGQSQLTVEMRDNYLDPDFGTHILRCRTSATCIIENNTLGGTPYGSFIYSDGNGGTARCNRMADGSLVPNNFISGMTVDNSAC